MKTTQRIGVVLALAIASVALAHVDRLIQLQDGKLIGLPEIYSPAEYDATTHRLRVGSRQMTFSTYLQSLTQLPHDLTLTASWYHDTTKLPPYLAMRIMPRGRDFQYRLLFDLDTLKLIRITKTVKESDRQSRDVAITLTDEQQKDITDSISVVK